MPGLVQLGVVEQQPGLQVGAAFHRGKHLLVQALQVLQRALQVTLGATAFHQGAAGLQGQVGVDRFRGAVQQPRQRLPLGRVGLDLDVEAGARDA